MGVTDFVKRRSGVWLVWQTAATIGISTAALGAWAAEPGGAGASARMEASGHFDRAVEHFQAADFEAAARAFLMADRALPDGDTLSNALNSAKRSGSHLLVALVSERAIEAHSHDHGLVRLARAALASAMPHLGRLSLSCGPGPCALLLDDAPIAEGRHLVDPGTHRVAARFDGSDGSNTVEQTVEVAAGTSYIYRLEPSDPPEPRAARSPQGPGTETGHAVANEKRSAPAQEMRRTFWQQSGDEVVFFSGVSVSVVLTGLVVWSGANTLSARGRMPEEPTRDERAEVQAKIIRTDALLGATVASATFSALWGALATDFRTSPLRPEVAVTHTGAWIGVRGGLK